MSCKVRFAPSPTGRMHIGNARIAIINFLFCQKNNGKFLFRIDDTDSERSKKEYEDSIREDLSWLQIGYDEFFRQSERIERYREVMNQLIQKGMLYKCYETQEELNFKRKNAVSKGRPPVYDRAALQLSEAEKKKLDDDGVPSYWRFRLPAKTISWDDMILGNVSYDLRNVSDPVIIKANGTFLYTFSSVVDDFDSGITNIIRGQDHVTNTAVQIALFDEISNGQYHVDFAHLSLLVNKDGSQFSKRLGSLSLGEIRKLGVDRMAIIDLLATLGSSLDTVPFHSVEELKQHFDITKFSSNSPKFDLDDILKLNRKLMHSMSFEEFENILGQNFITSRDAFDVVHENIESYNDFAAWKEVFSDDFKAKSKFSEKEKETLRVTAQLLKELPDLTEDSAKELLTAVSQKANVSGKELYVPIRKALTDEEHGPNIVSLICLLKKENILMRINRCL